MGWWGLEAVVVWAVRVLFLDTHRRGRQSCRSW